MSNNRQLGYGLTAETKRKIDAKYDVEMEREVLGWINDVLGGVVNGVSGKAETQQALSSGVVLCELMNKLSPGSIKKIHPATANKFKHQENIQNFLLGCEKYGCRRGDLFQTVDLIEDQDMPAVIKGILTLGRKATTNGYSGPCIGPKESQANPREFTEAQMLHGRVHGY